MRFKKIYREWLSDEGYLGIHLVLGFLIALIGGMVFIEIADEVFESEKIHLFDSLAQKFAKAIHAPELTGFMVAVTFLGELYSLIVLSLIVGLLLYFEGSHRRLYAFAAIMGGGGLLNKILKGIFARHRPDVEALIEAHGYSFPSGHAMGSALFFGGLGYVLFFTVKRSLFARLVGVALCVLAAFLVGFSRIYLGVHYASDVLAGFVGGVTWIAICICSTEAWIRWRDRRKRNQSTVSKSRPTSSSAW